MAYEPDPIVSKRRNKKSEFAIGLGSIEDSKPVEANAKNLASKACLLLKLALLCGVRKPATPVLFT